jgi:hypothetical protein
MFCAGSRPAALSAARYWPQPLRSPASARGVRPGDGPLQAGFDLLGGERARVALDDLRHLAGLGGRDRALGRDGGNGGYGRRHIEGAPQLGERKARCAVPPGADQAGNNEPQHGAVALHRLGERFPRDLATRPIKQLLDDHCCPVPDTGRLASRVAGLTLQEFALCIPLSLKLQLFSGSPPCGARSGPTFAELFAAIASSGRTASSYASSSNADFTLPNLGWRRCDCKTKRELLLREGCGARARGPDSRAGAR